MKNKSFSKIFIIALLLLLVLICIYLFLHSSFFNVTTIQVTNNHIVTRNEILAMAGISPGTNLFKIDQELTRRSVKLHPMVKEAQIIRHLPAGIEIKITERKSWAILPYNEIFLLIDDEGVCIDKLNRLPDQYVPIITMDKADQRINLGQAVNPAAIKMIRTIWQALNKDDRQNISQFHYINQNKELLIYTLHGTEIRFGNLDRLEEKVTHFSKVLEIEADLEKEGKEVLDYVDLRFKGQPVVKTRT